MAESESQHRKGIDNKTIEAGIEGMRRQFAEARLGQVFAFLISIAFVTAGTYLVAVKGQTAAGLILSTAGLGSIVTAFICGRAKKEESKPPQPPPNAVKKRKR